MCRLQRGWGCGEQGAEEFKVGGKWERREGRVTGAGREEEVEAGLLGEGMLPPCPGRLPGCKVPKAGRLEGP